MTKCPNCHNDMDILVIATGELHCKYNCARNKKYNDEKKSKCTCSSSSQIGTCQWCMDQWSK